MSVRSITVKGPALRVAIVGAYLARRWLSPGRRLVLAPDEENDARSTLEARPDHLRFHDEVGLPLEALIKEAGASLLFAPSYPSAPVPIRLPFLPVGAPIGGVEFQHYWLRANAKEPQPDLLSFSQAIVLQEQGRHQSWDRLPKSASGFGVTVNRQDYARLLIGLADRLGAEVTRFGDVADDTDLVFDCSGAGQPKWTGSDITLLEGANLPGIEWQVCVNAARRFAGLGGSSSHSDAEEREYTRLSVAEAQRIADMEELLASNDPSVCTSPTLRRKVELFAACGRIPPEDFEVFTQSEWLAALWQKGLRPRRYDRMADRLPETQLMSMLSQYRNQLAEMAGSKEIA